MESGSSSSSLWPSVQTLRDEAIRAGKRPLEAISFHRFDWSENNVDAICYSTALAEVEFIDGAIDVSKLDRCLSSLPNLKRLRFEDCDFRFDRRWGFRSRSVCCLEFERCRFVEELSPNFIAMPLLDTIEFMGCKPTPSLMHALTQCKSIESLSLYDAGFGDELVDAILMLRSLRTLNVTGAGVSREGLDRIRSQMPSVELKGEEFSMIDKMEVP